MYAFCHVTEALSKTEYVLDVLAYVGPLGQYFLMMNSRWRDERYLEKRRIDDSEGTTQ